MIGRPLIAHTMALDATHPRLGRQPLGTESFGWTTSVSIVYYPPSWPCQLSTPDIPCFCIYTRIFSVHVSGFLKKVFFWVGVKSMGALAHNIPCSRTLGSRCIYMIDTNDCAHIARFRSSCRILLINRMLKTLLLSVCLDL
jgi:hypothetical protein